MPERSVDGHASGQLNGSSEGNAEAAQYPTLPSKSYTPRCNNAMEIRINAQVRERRPYPLWTTAQAAWATVQRRYTHVNDVIFGTTTVSSLAGSPPTIIPLILPVNSDTSVDKFLDDLQNRLALWSRQEEAGVQEMSQVSDHADCSRNFQTLLILNSEESTSTGRLAQYPHPTRMPEDGFQFDFCAHEMPAVALVVECSLSPTCIHFRLNHDTNVIGAMETARIGAQFAHVFEQLCHSEKRVGMIGDISLCSPQDLQDIWTWNATVPNAVEVCLHALIEKMTVEQPDSSAVSAWDGELSYGNLNELSSKLACHLLDLGVASGSIVPICFKRSKWMVVALLGILKTGAAFAPIDPRAPRKRQIAIMEAVECTVYLTDSADIREPGSRQFQLVRVPQDIPSVAHTQQQVAASDPKANAYVLFTSGSTGTPKGVVLSHRAAATSVLAHGEYIGYSNATRMLCFCSLTFDASIMEIITTLVMGGCVCVPSDTETLAGIEEFIACHRVTMAWFTPSMLKLLPTTGLESLETMVCGGEMADVGLYSSWAKRLKLFHGYGPTETCVFATVWRLRESDERSAPLGRGVAGCLWVANQDDPTQLVGVGMPGELLVEGPTLAEGYLGDLGKTTAAFIEDPPWLVSRRPAGVGRAGRRLYRTGDLVRSRPDGVLEILGRKDGQAKIRGQRLELGEVEHHVGRLLREYMDEAAEKIQVVAEIVTLRGSEHSKLVLFVAPLETKATTQHGRAETAAEILEDLDSRLSEILPSYMIPTGYVLLAQIPTTISQKSDRGRLRQLAARLSIGQIGSFRKPNASFREPQAGNEQQLRTLWASVLGVKESMISADDSFLRLGGDSIIAVWLSSEARKSGLSLSVSNILLQPRLSDMAKSVAQLSRPDTGSAVAGFELLPDGLEAEAVRQTAASLCNIQPEHIADVFPCTPLQEGLLASTAQRTADYVAKMVFELSGEVNISTLQNAWSQTVRNTQILRTRIVDLPGHGLFQVVYHPTTPWTRDSSLKHYLWREDRRRDQQRSMSLNTPLCCAGLVEDQTSGKTYFVLHLHHALYDGCSLPMILDEVENTYYGTTSPPQVPMQGFVRYLRDIDANAARSFWQRQLADSEVMLFPALPAPSYRPRADHTHAVSIDDLQWPDFPTAATVVRAAWTLTQAAYTDSDEAIFWAVVSGRQAPVAGIQRMIGPTLATVPVRVSAKSDFSVRELLQRVQDQAGQMVPYEQMGRQWIRQISEVAERCTLARTLLVVQPGGTKNSHGRRLLQETDGVAEVTEENGHGVFNNHAIVVACTLRSHGLQLRLGYDTNVMDARQAIRLAKQFEHTIRQLVAPGNASKKIAELDWVNPGDKQDIWSWNAEVPQVADTCVHEIITEVARQRPDAPAVAAHDGALTYQQLDELSTRLAQYLVEHGCRPVFASDISAVSLCFEKSMWVPVSMLAVMKAGVPALALDITLPEARLREMVLRVKPRIILSSVKQRTLAARLDTTALVICPATLEANASPKPTLPYVDPSAALYIIFTSGSTGAPKGVIISHANFASALFHQRSLVGIGQSSRVLDLASYAFDVAWATFLFTAASGACLCIAAKDPRNDLARCINAMKVDHIGVTPSLARTIKPSDVSSLKTLIVAGEPLTADVVRSWASSIRLVQLYGPAECSAGATGNVMTLALEEACNTIGRPHGLNAWIVRKDGKGLASVGAVGELYLEGPLVGQSYLGDSQQTQAAFIQDPHWLLHGPNGFRGRRGRVYRTGDIVKYDAEGNLLFLGRRDTQAKIRGQRLELGEVEVYAREFLGPRGYEVVAEIITPREMDTNLLVAFVESATNDRLVDPESEVSLRQITSTFKETLATRLPSYMIPSAVIPLAIPLNSSGKTDRRKLRQIGAAFTHDQLLEFGGEREKFQHPVSAEERHLQSLWSNILRLPLEQIGALDGFLRLGGDSISAMRLTAAARASGFDLATVDVLRYPTLREMAQRMQPRDPVSELPPPPPPFSLLNPQTRKTSLRDTLARLCDVPNDLVVDAFPCTAMQEGLLARTSQHNSEYVARFIFEIPCFLDLARFVRAVNAVIKATPILRTRIVDLPRQGLVQAVINQDFELQNEVIPASVWADECGELTMGLGSVLCRVSLVRDENDSQVTLAWLMHHALYDDHSMMFILRRIEAEYDEEGARDYVPFQCFVEHLMHTDRELAMSFWKRQFTELEAPQFPSLLSQPQSFHPQADSTVRLHIPSLQTLRGDVTIATAVRAAWGVLQARYTDSRDVVFGAVVTGRHASLDGIDRVLGPTIATLPVRMVLHSEMTVSDLLCSVHSKAIEMTAYEQTGLQSVQQSSEEARRACAFQTLLVVHTGGETSSGNTSSFISRANNTLEGQETLGAFNTYALVVDCSIKGQGVEIQMSYDSRVLMPREAKRIAHQYETVLRQICDPDHNKKQLAEVGFVGEHDLNEIHTWNASLPTSVEACVHDIIAEGMQRTAPAVCAWDGELTYGELDQFSTTFARQLLYAGVRPNTLVPLCFEKSVLMPIAILGVMKAGAASVALDVSMLPESRLRSIMEQVQPVVTVASAANEKLMSRLNASKVTLLTRSILTAVDADISMDAESLPQVQPSHLLYAIFTSGTTGRPKGVLVSHSNFASAIHHQQETLRFKRSTRIFDFASYAFDTSWSNILHVLAVGGCLCIPSPEGRVSDPVKEMVALQANYVDLTPSIGPNFDFAAVPGLETLVFGGEPLYTMHFEHCPSNVEIINTFGPSETTVIVTAGIVGRGESSVPAIGRAVGARTWIVDPLSAKHLVPIGGIGELWIEGPLVGHGYLQHTEATTAVFLDHAPWLQPRHPDRQAQSRFFRTQDLVRYRSDGSIEYVRRKDAQVKIRGQRVELEEVDSIISRHLTQRHGGAELAHVASAARTSPITGQIELVTFISPRGAGAMDMHELCNKVSTLTRGLIDELAALVPSSMVPSSFRPSHWTPQTATGKVDRRALAAEAAAVTEASLLFESMNLRTGRTTPFDRTEKTMQRVWADVLHLPVDEVPVDVPFARLRGDSISAMQVVGRCRAEGITLTMARLLELQTIERLAAVDSERRETFVAEVGKDAQEAVTWNLSPIQKWYFEAHPAGINHYNQAYFAEISPEFTDSSLNQAVHALVERHGMLRARFIRNEPHQWHQRVLPYSPHVARVMSYTAEDESEVREVAARQQEMLDIIHGPVFAADIFTIGNKRQILLLTAHHLVIDVVSWSTIFYDLERLLLQRNEQLPSIVSFQTWCRMQETETMALVPKQALPAPLLPSDTYFWGFDASLNSYGDTKTLVSQLSAEATTFLLGYSNVSMPLEPVDLIVGALLHAFQAAFNTRSPPIVMLEGHGREPFEGSQDLDLSEVVGWFTTLCPIQIPWRATGGRLDTIGQVYTIRRQIPGKGRPYFACRYLQAHQEWLDVFGGNSTPELVFNYFGTSTRFGAVYSPFRRFGTVPNQMSSQAKRLSIFDVTARIDAGQLSLELTFPRHLKRLEQIEQWWDIYVKALERLQVDLENHM